MRLPEPPTYEVGEIERKAHEFLRERYGSKVPVPVDVDLLLETLPGVVLDYWPALRANHGLDGMVLRNVESGEVVVYIDEQIADSQPNRYRMTVGEELAHLILHRNVIDQVLTTEDFKELQNHYRAWNMERNAKRFAAAILMPAGNVLARAGEYYPQFVRTAGYGNKQAILKQLAVTLARDFVVSVMTMEIRITEWPIRLNEKVESAMQDRLDFLG